MRYHRIQIISTSLDLHGVLLRETIRKEFCQFKGTVQNVIGDTQQPCTVLLKLEAPDDVSVDALRGKVEKAVHDCPGLQGEGVCFESGKENVSIAIAPFGSGEIIDMPPQGIFILRGLENREIAWALQGAGKVFMQSSKLQQQVLDELKVQHGARVVGLHMGLNLELIRRMDMVSSVFSHRFFSHKDMTLILDSPALDRFLIECPSDEETIKQITEYRSSLDKISSSLRGKTNGRVETLAVKEDLESLHQETAVKQAQIVAKIDQMRGKTGKDAPAGFKTPGARV